MLAVCPDVRGGSSRTFSPSESRCLFEFPNPAAALHAKRLPQVIHAFFGVLWGARAEARTHACVCVALRVGQAAKEDPHDDRTAADAAGTASSRSMRAPLRLPAKCRRNSIAASTPVAGRCIIWFCDGRKRTCASARRRWRCDWVRARGEPVARRRSGRGADETGRGRGVCGARRLCG